MLGHPPTRSLAIRHDHFEGAFLHGIAKRVVGLHDLAQGKVVRNQLLRVNPSGKHCFQQHGSRHGINQPRGQGNVVCPELVQIQWTGLPCTPILAICPPAVTMAWHTSKLEAIPIASIATSTPL